MRILYFASVDFYMRPNPSFHLMYTMIEDLLSNGDEVYFVGCSMEGVEIHIPKEFEMHPKFSYLLSSVHNTAKSNFVRRYMGGIKYAYDSKKKLKKFDSLCDVVFIQSSPTALYNICVAKKVLGKHKRIIYNIQDMFPGSSIASGVMTNRWMQRFFFRLQKIAYKKANTIVVISDDMKEKLLAQGVSEDKVEVIVNWYDDRSVSEVKWEKNRLVASENMSKGSFYVQYAGTMGYVFDYQMILSVAELLINEENIVFQMIGEGSQKQDFVDEVVKRKLTNVVFIPLQPQNMVSDVYSSCSVCIIPLKKGVIGNSVPSKAGLVMACKRPIITSTDSQSKFNSMINENELGFAFGNDEPKKVAEAILFLYRNREICIQMGLNGYAFGRETYSRTVNMKKYFKVFKQNRYEGVQYENSDS